MLHLICSNVREHQKGKFIVLVTERDIVGASCYLKMINKNSYWFCKVNKSSCSNDSVSQWKGLVELLWHSADPPTDCAALLARGYEELPHLSLSTGAFEPQGKHRATHFVHREHGGATTDLLVKVRVGLNGCPADTGAAQQCFVSPNKPLEAKCKQVDIQGTRFYNHCFFLGSVFSVICVEIFLSLSGLGAGVLILGAALAGI